MYRSPAWLCPTLITLQRTQNYMHPRRKMILTLTVTFKLQCDWRDNYYRIIFKWVYCREHSLCAFFVKNTNNHRAFNIFIDVFEFVLVFFSEMDEEFVSICLLLFLHYISVIQLFWGTDTNLPKLQPISKGYG